MEIYLHILPDAYTYRSNLMLVNLSFIHKIGFDMWLLSFILIKDF